MSFETHQTCFTHWLVFWQVTSAFLNLYFITVNGVGLFLNPDYEDQVRNVY